MPWSHCRSKWSWGVMIKQRIQKRRKVIDSRNSLWWDKKSLKRLKIDLMKRGLSRGSVMEATFGN